MSFFVKDPDAVLDYMINWANWLDGDTIASSTFTLSPTIVDDSVTLDGEAIVPLADPDAFDGEPSTDLVQTVFWLSGGTVNATYSITNHIVSVGGRENDATIKIRIKEK